MACTWDLADNRARAEALVRAAAAQGARLILLQELFETPYFCATQDPRHLDLAQPASTAPLIRHFAQLAQELQVVLPLSFFERAGPQVFNSVAMIDATGHVLGLYRKTHIPQGPGYEEKFYFTPGDTGFRVWDTAVGRVGVGICWDQWFPEAARAMVLQGAELLLYPTAIGSEPQDPALDSAPHWRRVMQGHAAANMVTVAAANRVGQENEGPGLTFYGQSLITDETGGLLAEMDARPGVALAEIDLKAQAQARARAAWGLFRDRRPRVYESLAQDGYALAPPVPSR